MSYKYILGLFSRLRRRFFLSAALTVFMTMLAYLKSCICCNRRQKTQMGGLDEKVVILPGIETRNEQPVEETLCRGRDERLLQQNDGYNLAAQTDAAHLPHAADDDDQAIDKSEQERLQEQNRKAGQMYDIFKQEDFDATLNEWRVETHRSPTGKLYTTFHHNSNKFRSLKSVRSAVIGLKQAYPTEICDLCKDEIGFKLNCGHLYCQTCLNDYFRLTPPEMILDQLHLLPMCPSCKINNVVSFLSNQEQAQLIQLGVLQKDVVQKLDRYAASCAVQDPVYDCIQADCDERWTLSDMPIRPGTNRYEVTCPKCKCHQCSNCGKSYSQHDKVMCWIVPNEEDAKTMSYLQTHAVKCPGECGQWLSKDDSEAASIAEGCNVIKCMKDRLYVCALCGQKLNSSKFDVKDTAHILANEHFSTGPASCRGHLFTSRKEWLKRKESKLLTISL